MSTFWKAAACSFLALGLAATFASAQTGAAASTASRILEPIDDTKIVRLAGNTHPMAQPKSDLGLVDRSLPMDRVVLVLKRSPQQEAALEKFMAQQYNQNSPNYHHWLHAQEFGELYGPADSDISMITGWLQKFGLHVDNVSKGRTTMEFSGTAAQIEQAFHTEMHRYRGNGVEHIANSQDPAIPQALAPVVTGIASLNNFFPKPLYVLGKSVKRDKKTGKITPLEEPSSVPQLTWTNGGPAHEDITPFDFATIYNLLPTWNAGTTGKGVTIAISAGSDVDLTDVSTFRSVFGLPANPLTVIHNGTDPGLVNGYQQENTLDVEWSGATAPGATIDLVVSGDTQTTLGLQLSDQYIVDNEVAPIMSASYGQCELALGSAGNSAFNAIWQQGAAEGISIFESSGDQGSTGCDSSHATPPDAAVNGLQVNGMASSPYVTAVGGTDFTWQASPLSTYWNATNNADGATAKGYIPEMPWNSTCASLFLVQAFGTGTPEAFCNDILAGTLSPDPIDLVTITAGSGGKSACTTPSGSTPSTCAGGYAKPSWQTGTGVPADGKRDLPDVSLFASGGYPDGLNGSAYLVCISSQSPIGTCAYDANDVIFQEIGGTSASSPAMAGIMALVLQKIGAPQGLANPVLYSLFAGETLATCNSSTVTNGNSCIFYDTTFGTIAQPCITGSTNCVTSTAGDQVGIVSGYSTTTGYDLATGLGSVNVTNLVNAWPNAIGKVTLTPTSLTFPSTNVGTPSAPMVMTVKNTGTGILSFNSIQLAETAAKSYSGTTTCPLAPSYMTTGSSCTVSITFTPTTTGTITAQLDFFDNATGEPQTAALSGTGASGSAPAVMLTPSSLTFATFPIGTTSAASNVTLKNTGTAALSITGIALTGTNPGDFSETTTCTSSLAAGASCTISVKFKPTASGARSAAVSITDNASGSPQQITLSGTGTAAKLSVTSLNFGTVAVGVLSAAKSVTLTNTSAAAFNITSIGLTGTNPGDFSETTTCGASLAAAASCTISVKFKPTTSGARSAAISITDAATGSPQQVTLSGTGTTAKLSLTSLSFGTVALGVVTAAKAVTLTNIGTAALSITSIGITGTNAGDFSETTTCGSSLAVSASCTISVKFAPTATGARSATVSITDSASGSPQQITLTGTGTTAKLSLTSLSFGSVTVGTTSAAKIVTLTNVGTTILTISGAAISGTNAADFAETTTCTSSLAVNASCTYSVTFKPGATGARSGVLKITDSAAGSPQQVTLSGTGS